MRRECVSEGWWLSLTRSMRIHSRQIRASIRTSSTTASDGRGPLLGDIAADYARHLLHLAVGSAHRSPHSMRRLTPLPPSARSSIPPLWPLITIYLIWMWFDDAHESGGRRVEYIRRLSVFKYFAQYFPVSRGVGCGGTRTWR